MYDNMYFNLSENLNLILYVISSIKHGFKDTPNTSITTFFNTLIKYFQTNPHPKIIPDFLKTTESLLDWLCKEENCFDYNGMFSLTVTCLSIPEIQPHAASILNKLCSSFSKQLLPTLSELISQWQSSERNMNVCLFTSLLSRTQ